MDKKFMYISRIVVSTISVIMFLIVLYILEQPQDKLKIIDDRSVYTQQTTHTAQDQETKRVTTNYNTGCIQRESSIVNGSSMSNSLPDGKKVTIYKDYYECNPVELGDIITYQYGNRDVPIIKKVMVSSKQAVELKNNTLFIDGVEMKTSNGESYTFNNAEIKILGMYIKNGHIPKNSYFIFGDSPEQNLLDSRKFGAVSSDDFIGKYHKD